MSYRDSIPFGVKTVSVAGQGTYGFQSVGNTSHTTGFDVYFHPEGMPARAPGYGRMRLVITDDLGWDVEYVGTERLSQDVVRAAAEPAREWMAGDQNCLLFSLLGAAKIGQRAIKAERDSLVNRLAWRTNGLRQDRMRPTGSNDEPLSSPEKVESARKALADFDERIKPRARVLATVLKVADEFSYPDRRGGRTMDEFLAEARDEMFPSSSMAPSA